MTFAAMPRHLVKTAYLQACRDGETRTRTGDTTIFSQLDGLPQVAEVPASACFCKLDLARVPCGFVGFPAGYGRGGSATSFSRAGVGPRLLIGRAAVALPDGGRRRAQALGERDRVGRSRGGRP